MFWFVCLSVQYRIRGTGRCHTGTDDAGEGGCGVRTAARMSEGATATAAEEHVWLVYGRNFHAVTFPELNHQR